jgi:hypothetical protein
MTNGEMIQKIFNCEVCEPIMEDDIINVIFADKKDSAISFDWSWWNSEYKEQTTKNKALDKIRAEIEQRQYGIANDSVIQGMKLQGMKHERAAILEIIDKYKAESEK